MCDRQRELLADYEEAASKYAALVAELRAKLPILPLKEYDVLRVKVEMARLDVERIRLDLDLHVAEHGCAPRPSR
jgi:hypothetical protein